MQVNFRRTAGHAHRPYGPKPLSYLVSLRSLCYSGRTSTENLRRRNLPETANSMVFKVYKDGSISLNR
jgi:hypothetical protein